MASPFCQKQLADSNLYSNLIKTQGGYGLEHNENTLQYGKALKPGEKYNLTIKEASAYFSLGEKKLRRIAEDNPDAGFVLMNGSHILIKRTAFEKYIDAVDSI